MTGKEVADMIEKSKERVRELEEKGILSTQYIAYHQGYQDALTTIKMALEMEAAFNEAIG